MNKVEVFKFKEETDDIEFEINRYCEQYGLNPISISIAYSERDDLWVVCVVVEAKE